MPADTMMNRMIDAASVAWIKGDEQNDHDWRAVICAVLTEMRIPDPEIINIGRLAKLT